MEKENSSFLAKFFNKYFNQIIENPSGLSDEKVAKINKKLQRAKSVCKKISDLILDLSMILEYDNMKKSGVQVEDLIKYSEEDKFTIKKALDFCASNEELHNHMFGYPAHMKTDSAITNYLKKEEANLYLMNNCGDPYEAGYYQMDSKNYEQEILKIFYDRFGISQSEGWGYITSGGSESNKWGVYNGLKKYPEARVYFCESSHYSIEKAVFNGDKNLYNYSVIKQETEASEKIDKESLFLEIKKNWDERKEASVILLTWGTTKTGAIDDVKDITDWLETNKIPHYIHLDAAFFGGIPKNQIDAPIVPSMDEFGIDSISISFHKYIGSSYVNSIVLAKEKISGEVINYIGQTDGTTAGSRTFHPFSTLQKVKEAMQRDLPHRYSENVVYFENLLKNEGVKYRRDNLSNIFVIKKPSDEICKYYQLSTFTDHEENELAHLIVFPSHKKEVMESLAKNLACNSLKYT